MSETSKSSAEHPVRTVTINVPASGSLFGLGPIISWLLLAAAWCVVGIAYLCAFGFAVVALLIAAIAAMNFGFGLVPFALAAGMVASCIGLCVPCFAGANALRCLLLKRPVKLSMAMKCLLAISILVLLAGCAIVGLAVLAGGGILLL